MDDIFAVQDDIATSVVGELRSRLLGGSKGPDAEAEVESEVQDAVKGRAANAEAQRLMLLGRHFLDRTTREDTAKAITYFRQALEVDPGYALCWAELGRAYSIEAGRAWVPVGEGFDRSRAAAKRALELEPDLAEGHAQLGRIMAAYDRDLKGADGEYNRALELAPGSSAVLDGASILAYKLGRFDRAVELSRRVLAQDPLSAAFWHNLGLTCFAAHDLPQSGAAYRRALDLVPQRLVTRALLALTLAYQCSYDAALTEAQLEPANMWRTWSLAIVHQLRGDFEASDHELANLLENQASGNAFQIAEVHAVRGEIDDAFEWLNKAHEQRDSGLSHAKVDPNLQSLHSDPRWPELLHIIGFSE
jgi:tetratricopeptide (TPR) repeat protein